MEIKKYIAEDGRRIQERITELVGADSTEKVWEMHEEVIPTRLSKKITTKIASIPIEEKTEVFLPDGAVETTVKSIPSSSMESAPKEPELKVLADKLDRMSSEIAHLKDGIQTSDTVKAIYEKIASMSPRATDEETSVDTSIKIEAKKMDVEPEPPMTKVSEQSNSLYTIIAGICWGAAAVAGAYLVYRMVPGLF